MSDSSRAGRPSVEIPPGRTHRRRDRQPGLRRRGIDVTTTAEAGLLNANDERHVTHALADGRVIVTHDVDFLRIAASGQPHAGIVHVGPSRTVGEVIRFLVLMHDVLSENRMHGQVE